MHKKKFPSIAIVLILTIMMFDNPVLICIKQINLYIQSTTAMCIFAVSVILWYSCFTGFRRSCCNNTWLEVLFYLFPAEVFLSILFAQYHFWISVVIFFAWIVIESAFTIFVDLEPSCWRSKGRMIRRFTVTSACILCALPSLFAVFIYGLEPPTYIADVEESETGSELGEDTYENNLNLLLQFEESTWDTLSLDEKLSKVRSLIDFESNVLGFTAVSVVGTELMESSLLGYYDDEENEIFINIILLEYYSPEYVIQTVCHETFHSYQYYLISNTNWENNVLYQTAYFSELYSWKCNAENYKSVYLYGYEEYANQPLEYSAREYASEEKERICTYIDSNQK